MNRSPKATVRQLVSFGDKQFFKLLVNFKENVKPPDFIKSSWISDQYKFVQRTSRLLLKFSKTTILAFCVGNTFFSMIGYPACVNGKSMQPVFNFNQNESESSSYRLNFSSWRNSSLRLDLDWVFVNCWAARKFKFSRGDIVVFVSPKDPYDYVIKRVIAQEGDELNSFRYEKNHVVIPEGHCWVEGDNWDNSVDSNRYGPIPTGLVFGVATHVIWPPHKWQRMSPSIPPSLLPERVIKAQGDVADQCKEQYRSWLTRLKILFYFIKN